MTRTYDLGPPARALDALLAATTEDHLRARTPCAEYTVGDLLDHLMGLTVAFRSAAEKSPGADTAQTGTDGPGESSGPPKGNAANLHPAWRERLPVQLDELVAAWREPSAWTGMTEAGGVTLPADIMGTVAVNELVIHGWDLARATGQAYECAPDSAQASFEFTSVAAAPGEGAGREGIFGPVVDVPPDATVLDRSVGLSGRDPSWRP